MEKKNPRVYSAAISHAYTLKLVCPPETKLLEVKTSTDRKKRLLQPKVLGGHGQDPCSRPKFGARLIPRDSFRPPPATFRNGVGVAGKVLHAHIGVAVSRRHHRPRMEPRFVLVARNTLPSGRTNLKLSTLGSARAHTPPRPAGCHLTLGLNLLGRV